MGWEYLNKIVCISIIEYLLAFIMADLVALGIGIANRYRKSDQFPNREAASTD